MQVKYKPYGFEHLRWHAYTPVLAWVEFLLVSRGEPVFRCRNCFRRKSKKLNERNVNRNTFF